MITPPTFDPAAFSDPTTVTNPYFPLPGGTINSYEAVIVDPEIGEVETERNDHFATFETKAIAGLDTVVVRDTAYDDGVIVEDTLDWYAEDDLGNVWYMGEIAINYNYDDEGEFIGTDFGGSWETDVDGGQPGYIMLASPTASDKYFQEFYAGIAEDQGEVIATGLTVETELGTFNDVVKILDTSPLEPDVGAFKYFAPGVGMVFEEEIELAAPDDPEVIVELQGIRTVTDAGTGAVEPTELSFGNGQQTVTFLTEDASQNGAIGAYTFNLADGTIGEGRILFADTEDVGPGTSVTVDVPAGYALGLFLVPGVELEDYLDGGLFFRNMLSGDVADVYDGNPGTTYTPGPATIYDGLSPLITDADGNILPIRAFHSVGNRDGFNFLNHVAGKNAMESDAGDAVAGVEVVSFEDGLASTKDYDEDFDDAFLAVSDGPLSEGDLETLLDEIGISRIVGSDGQDELHGTDDDDQLIALEGNDRIFGGDGDDQIEASDGNDRADGGDGDDEIDGEDGNDWLSGGDGDDEIDGGDGNDRLDGGAGEDEMNGDEGHDLLHGGDDYDTLRGGEGSDTLFAGGDGARMAGGEGDNLLVGAGGAADVFVFDLTLLGDDTILGFQDGTDMIEIATYTEVENLGDIDVEQSGMHTVLGFAEGTVTLKFFDSSLIDASDFAFV